MPESTQTLTLGTRRLPRGASPLLMGIVNVTPDSFSDGGRYLDIDAAVRHGMQLLDDGADLLDIGGESSRPGAEPVPDSTEWERIGPVLEALRARTQAPLSVDTTKSSVARRALDGGADLINDISGLRFDPEMVDVVAASRCGVVVMHMQGEPRTMQQAPRYDDVVEEVGGWLRLRAAWLARRGIDASRLILDPGIGFGKSFEHNLELLRALPGLRLESLPLLIGTSRKAFLGLLLDEPQPDRRLEGDLALAAHCRRSGVDILRVHDVRASRRLFRVLEAVEPLPFQP